MPTTMPIRPKCSRMSIDYAAEANNIALIRKKHRRRCSDGTSYSQSSFTIKGRDVNRIP